MIGKVFFAAQAAVVKRANSFVGGEIKALLKRVNPHVLHFSMTMSRKGHLIAVVIVYWVNDVLGVRD